MHGYMQDRGASGGLAGANQLTQKPDTTKGKAAGNAHRHKIKTHNTTPPVTCTGTAVTFPESPVTLNRNTQLSHLHRVHFVLLGQLVDRLLSGQCLQSYLGLELGCVELALLCFSCHRVLLMTVCSLNYCPEIGVHFTMMCRRAS